MSDQLSKAVIEAKELNAQVQCKFNPREYVVAKSANWMRTPVRGAASAPMPEFVGTNPRVLQIEIFFDDWESGSGDVSKDVETLLAWTNPTQDSINANKPSPPIVCFQWGTKPLFDAFVKSINARYTMFRGDGTPVRAHVTAVFEEVPSEPGRQNPTSGGKPGRRIHTIEPGETLQWIAFREYGDPTLWRGLAHQNGIHNPLASLTPGRTLLIPPEATLVELS
jgi:Contractile injection system tube protein